MKFIDENGKDLIGNFKIQGDPKSFLRFAEGILNAVNRMVEQQPEAMMSGHHIISMEMSIKKEVNPSTV